MIKVFVQVYCVWLGSSPPCLVARLQFTNFQVRLNLDSLISGSLRIGIRQEGFDLWSLPELSEGPVMLAEFIYDILNWFYD